MNADRFTSFGLILPLEYSGIFHRCMRVSIKKTLQAMTREHVVQFAALLNRVYCNQPAFNIALFLSSSSQKFMPLMQKIKNYVAKQKVRHPNADYVVALDVTPLEILRYAFSYPVRELQVVNNEEQIEYDFIKMVTQLNEQLMKYHIGKKDAQDYRKLLVINNAAYNDVLSESQPQYQYQSLLSIRFFRLVESQPKYANLLEGFYRKYGIESWKDYVRTLYALALFSYRDGAGVIHANLQIDQDHLLSRGVLDALSIDVNCEPLKYASDNEFGREGNSNYRYFKDRPLFKNNNGDYVIHCPRLLIDRLYSSLYFDFKEIGESLERPKNTDGLFTSEFVEKIVFAGSLSACLNSDKYIGLDESSLKAIHIIKQDELGYPDYYVKNKCSGHVILWECKDIRLNGWIKDLRDYKPLEEEIRNRIVEKTYQLDWGSQKRVYLKQAKRIGIGQLAGHIASIRKGVFPWDKGLIDSVGVYTVLVIADNRMIFDGLAGLCQEWYKERLQKEGMDWKKEMPLIIMSPLTLIKYRPLFLKNGFEVYFNEYILSITKPTSNVLDAINRSISFDVFMQKYPTKMDGFVDEIRESINIPLQS